MRKYLCIETNCAVEASAVSGFLLRLKQCYTSVYISSQCFLTVQQEGTNVELVEPDRSLFVSRLPAGRVPAAPLQGADEELQPVRATGQQRLPQPDRPLQLQPAADHGRGESMRTHRHTRTKHYPHSLLLNE